MPDPTKPEAAEEIRAAINTALWVGLTSEQVQAIVTAHLIDKEKQ